MRYLLRPYNTMIVRGPASFRLLSGDATILGAPLKNNMKLAVMPEKQLPIQAQSEVDMEIVQGESGRVFEIEGSTIPRSWQIAAETLAEMQLGRVIVIGASDTGKSTLCTYLTNQLLRNGISPRVVDADIGQADIGPPTTIASAVPHDYVTSLADLNPESLLFIGHTTPSFVERTLIERVRRLVHTDNARLTLINTDGWVLNPEAVQYKIDFITRIKPDVVLAITADSELQPILAGSRVRSLNIEAPQSILARSRADRRVLRVAGYRTYLEGASTKTISRQHVKVAFPGAFKFSRKRDTHELRNLIIGVLDSEGYLQHIGILLDFGERSLRMFSRAVNNMHEIELGYVKLSLDGEELGYLEM
jgi:polynucleotide 5'-hydroxyl-kinase GRC3/NOL9